MLRPFRNRKRNKHQPEQDHPQARKMSYRQHARTLALR
jgi:hypothetical protein